MTQFSTVIQEEVNKFSRIAKEWWDPNGKFKPLHQFNPIRISYLQERINSYFFNINSNLAVKEQWQKLKILDLGCGGGLVAEAMARNGAQVVAIDASEKNIEVAKTHLQESSPDLNINYQNLSIEEFVSLYPEEKFDIILALEIIEHVDNQEIFIQYCQQALKSKDSISSNKGGGLLFIATINRNIKSLLTAKFAAEYLLRWLPIGTHQWHKFLKPSEINSFASRYYLQLNEICGFKYCLLKQKWGKSPKDSSINYIMDFCSKQ